MRRSLATLAGLGMVTTSILGTGVLAPATDVSRTGVVRADLVQSGSFSSDVDLQIARPDGDGCVGAPYSDDLSTGLISIQTGSERTFSRTERICVRNFGTDPATLSVGPVEGSWTSPSCSASETRDDPQGCEQSRATLWFTVAIRLHPSSPRGCPAFPNTRRRMEPLGRDASTRSGWQSSLDPEPNVALATLSPGDDCLYEVEATRTDPLTEADQTDRVEWKFQFAAVTGASSASTPLPRSVNGRRRIGSLLDGKLERGRTLLAGSTRRINLEGRGDVSVQQIAEAAFAKHRERDRSLVAVQRGLLGAPVTREEVVETDQGVALRATTTVTVVDPRLVASVPGFARTPPSNPGTWVANWPADQRATFEADLALAPANHPLRIAAAQGETALLRAIEQGQGDVTVTTELFFPTVALEINDDGYAEVPQMRNGRFDYDDRTRMDMRLLPPNRYDAPSREGAIWTEDTGAQTQRRQNTDGSRTEETFPTTPPTTTIPSARNAMAFLAGFTAADGFEWTETIDAGPIGYVTVGAHASYGFGLRIPIEVVPELTPRNVVDVGAPGERFETALTARVFDANAEFYQRTGINDEFVLDGKELVIQAGAWASIEGEVLGQPFEEEFGKKFDFSQNFSPPWDDCRDCGIEAWIPASVTRTEINIAGIVTGSAQVGFQVGGSGEVNVDYSSRFDGSVARSTYRGNSSAVHVWRNSGARDSQRFTTDVSAEAIGGLDALPRPVGFRVSEPGYTWNVAITPGVKGSVDVAVLGEFEIGPLWLRPFAVNLGSVVFPTHPTSNRFYERNPSTYTPPSLIRPDLTVPPSSNTRVEVQGAR